MGYFSHRGIVSSGYDSLDQAISDLELMITDVGIFLVSTSGANGGIASYQIDPQGGLSVIDTHFFTPAQQTLGSAEISALSINGTRYLVTETIGSQTLVGQSWSNDGQLGGTTNFNGFRGVGGEVSAMLDLSLSGGQFVFMAEAGGTMLNAYQVTGNNQVSHFTGSSQQDSNTSYLAGVSDMAQAMVNGTPFLLTLSATENGVSCFAVGPSDGGLDLCHSFGMPQGLGIGTATDLEVVTVFGQTFVIIAAAGSSSLSVLHIANDGGLSYRDHILDTQHTNFGGVTSVTSIDIDGQTFVIAGGADDGLSLFTVLPDGRLHHLESIIHDGSNGLDNIESIVATRLDDDIQIMVASGGGIGISQFTIDLPRFGSHQIGNGAANVLTGTGDSEILSGGAGNDRINGGFGMDFIYDGYGQDMLTGSGGGDVFILSADGQRDHILDFQPYYDRLDLSAFTMLYSHRQIEFTATDTGAILTYRDEVIELTHGANKPLKFHQVLWGSFSGPNRPNFHSVAEHTGTAQDDQLTGSYVADRMVGGNGNDILAGQEGSDTLIGGNGNDRLYGGGSGDVLRGDAGNDLLVGGDGNDILWGGKDNDALRLGAGDDIAHLGDGHDRAKGQSGNDEIYGEAGKDRVFGHAGDDVLDGGTNNDLAKGGAGNDQIYGAGGRDKLFGNAGNDQIWGGDGADVCHLGKGADVAIGGAGDDRLQGSNGNDRLFGGNGRDVISGDQGADRIVGGKGHDICIGGKNNDILTGNEGRDTFVFRAGGGRDTITDFTSGQDRIHIDMARQTFRDLEITSRKDMSKITYDGGVILLKGFDAADLHADDFIFG